VRRLRSGIRIGLVGMLLLAGGGCIALGVRNPSPRIAVPPGPRVSLPPHTPFLNVLIAATLSLNNCGGPTAFPIRLRVALLRRAPSMAGMSVKRLWNNEEQVLDTDLVRLVSASLDPDSQVSIVEPLGPETRAVVVYGSFCKESPNCRYYVAADRVQNAGMTLRLTADANCLRLRD